MVRLIVALPKKPVVGEIEETTGIGFPTVNASADEAPPPGAGLTTVTLPIPGVDRSEAGICTLRAVEL